MGRVSLLNQASGISITLCLSGRIRPWSMRNGQSHLRWKSWWNRRSNTWQRRWRIRQREAFYVRIWKNTEKQFILQQIWLLSLEHDSGRLLKFQLHTECYWHRRLVKNQVVLFCDKSNMVNLDLVAPITKFERWVEHITLHIINRSKTIE